MCLGFLQNKTVLNYIKLLKNYIIFSAKSLFGVANVPYTVSGLVKNENYISKMVRDIKTILKVLILGDSQLCTVKNDKYLFKKIRRKKSNNALSR